MTDRRMDHIFLTPIEGVSGREATHVTMKSIKELMDEEQLLRSTRKKQAEAPTPPPGLQVPPHMRAATPAPAPAPEPLAATEEVTEEPVVHTDANADDIAPPAENAPRGFLRRLIGK